MTNFKLSDNSKKNREGIDDRLIRISDRAIQITTIDFGHGSTAGLRSYEVQNDLFREEKSKCDGYAKISGHQEGLALDFYAYIYGKASWDNTHLAMVATAFLQAASELNIAIAWGGLWAVEESLYGWDMPHIELKD